MSHKISANLEENSMHAYEHKDFIVRQGFVLNENVKTLVSNLFPPNRGYFHVHQAGQFREHFLKTKGSLYVLVERRGTDSPAYSRVKKLDGQVMVLQDPLPFTPEPGACVQLLLGLDWKYVREKDLEAQEKKEGQFRWV